MFIKIFKTFQIIMIKMLHTLPYCRFLLLLLLLDLESPYLIAASFLICIYLLYDWQIITKLKTHPCFFWFVITTFSVCYSIAFWLARNDLNLTYGIYTQYLTFSPYFYACLIVVFVYSLSISIISSLFYLIISIGQSITNSLYPFMFFSKEINGFLRKQASKPKLIQNLRLISLLFCSTVIAVAASTILTNHFLYKQNNIKLFLLLLDSESVNSCCKEKNMSTRHLRINHEQCLKFTEVVGSPFTYRTEIINSQEP